VVTAIIAREAQIAKAEAGHGAGELQEIAHRQVAATQLLADEGDRGVAGNDRTVEVENRTDFRALG
jgi:hypothetical protein